MWGGVGRGKTLLMDLFFSSLQNAAAAPRAERSHFYHFMRAVHAELGSIKQHTEPLDIVAERLAAQTRLICLDEFFVTDIADAMILSGLFDGLFRRGVTLVTTSNVPPQDLYKDGLQRQRFLPAIDSILEHVDVLHLDGGIDYRLRQLEQAPTYLDSSRPDTPAALRTLFDALAGGIAAGPSTLCVEGREIRTVDSGSGLAWFEFSELCEGPRSQNDYIELARLYHTLMISNVPVFDLTVKTRHGVSSCSSTSVRPQREDRAVGRRTARGAVSRRTAAVRIRTRGKPSHRDADAGLSRRRTPSMTGPQA